VCRGCRLALLFLRLRPSLWRIWLKWRWFEQNADSKSVIELSLVSHLALPHEISLGRSRARRKPFRGNMIPGDTVRFCCLSLTRVCLRLFTSEQGETENGVKKRGNSGRESITTTPIRASLCKFRSGPISARSEIGVRASNRVGRAPVHRTAAQRQRPQSPETARPVPAIHGVDPDLGFGTPPVRTGHRRMRTPQHPARDFPLGPPSALRPMWVLAHYRFTQTWKVGCGSRRVVHVLREFPQGRQEALDGQAFPWQRQSLG